MNPSPRGKQRRCWFSSAGLIYFSFLFVFFLSHSSLSGEETYNLSKTPDITILYLSNKSITSLVSDAFNQVFSLSVSDWRAPVFFTKLTLVGSLYLHITDQMLPTEQQKADLFSPLKENSTWISHAALETLRVS